MNYTNEVIKELMERKSVRVYEDRCISEEDKKIILEAAVNAPTAGNMSLYTILDITDEVLKEKLSVLCDNQPFIKKAPMVLVFVADYKRWYDVFCRHIDREEVRKPSYGDMLLSIEDTMIAAQNAVTAAQSLGIGSCYIGDILENSEVIDELLCLPKYTAAVGMLCFGYPVEQQINRAKPVRFKTEDLVHENTYSSEKNMRMEEMLSERTGKTEEELSTYIKAFAARKWNSDFSIEMSRSSKEIIKRFCE